MPAPYTGGGPGNELRVWAQTVEGIGPALEKTLKPVFKRAAQNIKTDWQDNLRQSPYWRQIATTVGYDDISTDGVISFQIGTTPSERRTEPKGPRKRFKNGKLGRRPGGVAKNSGGLTHIAMGYTSRGGGHRTDPIEFLEEEAENLEREIGKAIVALFA